MALVVTASMAGTVRIVAVSGTSSAGGPSAGGSSVAVHDQQSLGHRLEYQLE